MKVEAFHNFEVLESLSHIKQVLEQVKSEVAQKYHVRTLGLFGSVVRNDFSADSDIDILVDFIQPIGIEFIDLAELIEKRLMRRIDLVSKNGIKEKYFKAIEKEIIYV